MKKRVKKAAEPAMKKRKAKPAAEESGPKIHPTEIVAIAALKPHPENYRRHPETQVLEIAESIKQHGIYKNIVVAQDGTILAGHGLVLGAQKLGLEQLPVVRIPLASDHPRARKLVAADNGIPGMAEDDPGMLATLLRAIRDEDEVGLLGTGYDEVSLKELLGSDEKSTEERKKAEREDEIPAPPKNPITKPGDVWILGDHRLICGDCRVLATVGQLLDGAKVNVAFTSPPYASQRKYDEESGFKPVVANDYVDWFAAVQANVREHLAKDGSWFVNIKEHCEDGQRHLYVKDLTIAHVRQWGWMFIDEFSWNRTAPPGRWPTRFKNGFEPVFHFAIGQCKFRPEAVTHESDLIPLKSSLVGANTQGTNGEHWNLSGEVQSGQAFPSNVIEVNGVDPKIGHPAAFPVALPEFFMKAFADQGDLVFDPFMGSGTTIIACEKTGRIARGVELSPAYCDVIIERWQTYTGKSARRAT